MQISLTVHTTVKEIKEAFSQQFPYLKLEFFHNKHQKEEGSFLEPCVRADKQLAQITGAFQEGNIHLAPTDTVADVEERFQNHLGLAVQIFRYVNGVWIETTKTDNLTLEQQNDMGKKASLHTTPVAEDYFEV